MKLAISSFKKRAPLSVFLALSIFSISGWQNTALANSNNQAKWQPPIINLLLSDDERVKGPRPTPLPDNGTLRRRTDGLNFESCRFRKGDGGKVRKNQPNRPQVIKFGFDNPHIWYLKDDRQQELDQDFIEQLNSPDRAFDGIGWSLRHATNNSMTDEQLDGDDMERRFAQYYDLAQNGSANKPNVKFNRVRHDMVRLLANHVDGGFQESTNYDAMISNLRNLARAASKRPGIKGILFDSEWYEQVSRIDPWNYSRNVCPGYNQNEKGKFDGFNNPADREACDIHAFNRGYDAMDAIIEEWPDVIFLTLFGIWTDDSRTFDYITGDKRDPHTGFAPHLRWHLSRGVMPHFLAGVFAATICTDATFVDGTELYGLYEKSDFVKAGNYITNLIVDDNPFLPPNIRESYRDGVGLGFGIYDFRRMVFANHEKFPMTSFDHNDWETVSKNASDTATHYVWMFTEIHDWWSADRNDWPRDPDDNRDIPEGQKRVHPVESDPEWIRATRRAIDYIKAK